MVVYLCIFPPSNPLRTGLFRWVGDIIRFSNEEGNIGGGEYGVYQGSGVTELFRTFCIQRDAYMNYTSDFQVSGISSTVQNQGHPLSGEAPYLFAQFSTGSLVGYDYSSNTPGHVNSANALQLALWALEDEPGAGVDTLSGQALTWYNFALGANASLKNEALSQVSVLNLVWATTDLRHVAGSDAQDVLIYNSVPEPSSLILLGED